MAGKKVIKAHRGFAHVPMRGGRRRPMGDPPRRIQQMPNDPRRLTPAQRDLMRRQMQDLPRRRQISRRRAEELARRRLDQAMRRRTRRRPIGTPVPQQRRARPVLPIQQRPTVEQLRQAQPVGRPQQVREAQPVGVPQEVRQAQQEPMQRPTGRRVAAKGKFITKKNIGANDYRQGGMVLNSVDNRKNKK